MKRQLAARESAAIALKELAQAWQQFNDAGDQEFWEAANARLTASLALCQAQLRALKQAAGYPLQDPAFCLPWIKPTGQDAGHARARTMARAS